jgi:hypothetical protein
MLVLRYFVFVGGALLALLLLSDAVLPKAPVSGTNVAAADLPMIRIHSEQKWPKAVVFDTNMPSVAPVTVASNAAAPAVSADKARVREAFAQLPAPQAVVAEEKAPEAKPPQRKRKVARARAPQRPLMVAAQQPHFGFFDTW